MGDKIIAQFRYDDGNGAGQVFIKPELPRKLRRDTPGLGNLASLHDLQMPQEAHFSPSIG
jgi:hypothetical protein